MKNKKLMSWHDSFMEILMLLLKMTGGMISIVATVSMIYVWGGGLSHNTPTDWSYSKITQYEWYTFKSKLSIPLTKNDIKHYKKLINESIENGNRFEQEMCLKYNDKSLWFVKCWRPGGYYNNLLTQKR